MKGGGRPGLRLASLGCGLLVAFLSIAFAIVFSMNLTTGSDMNRARRDERLGSSVWLLDAGRR